MAIFASCLFQSSTNGESFVDVQREWGAINTLEQFVIYDGVRREKEPELFGPFDVWNGELWRVPIAPFHHANLMHLVLCVGATWFLGSRLERYWGSFRMGMFFIPALSVPVMAQLLMGRAEQGFSGVACAMLGAIVVLRNDDPKLAERIPKEVGEIGMSLILVGCVATLFDLISVPNLAHLAGFFYGAMVAWMTRPSARHKLFLRTSFVLIHLWLIPGLFFASHPYWIGRFHWYSAVIANSPQRTERSLEKAVTYDPSLTGAWLHWSQVAEDRENSLLAWRRIINGLYFNPSNSSLMDGSRRLWRHLNARQRRDAEIVLSEFFGKHSDIWLDQIRANASIQIFESDPDIVEKVEIIDLQEFKLDQKQALPHIDLAPPLNRFKQAKPIIPNDASEGETL